ncbi:unnamed protein product [Enterobius vermicularis]|uniref:LAM_G_DOMAIN domain-containing protein n=1 Tax=Enterobius vermicularis TaxID=51028 RepID=A0A0N4VLW6_ENTVE|nr:unnamed protein product [Enterobius vermicularis]
MSSNSESETNLLGILGTHITQGDIHVRRVAGLDGFPAIAITRGGKFVAPYRLLLPGKFYENFSIAATVQPADREGGYLFAVLNALDTVVALGVLLEPADSSSGGNQTYIHLQYTDSMTASETKTLASFLVPDFTGKWTKIGIEVSGESVVLYFKCTRFAIERPVKKHPKQLRMNDAHKIYIGSGGPVLRREFEKEIFESGNKDSVCIRRQVENITVEIMTKDMVDNNGETALA